MAGYRKGSKIHLEKLETDIAFDLDKLAGKLGSEDKKLVDRVFDKLNVIHDEYSSKWADIADKLDENSEKL